MKKITVNGINYLGNLKEKDGKVTVKKAMKYDGAVNRTVLSEYLKKENLNQLQSPTFSGHGTSTSVDDLTGYEKLDLEICELTMDQAKKVAAAGTENKVFEQLLGKQ